MARARRIVAKSASEARAIRKALRAAGETFQFIRARRNPRPKRRYQVVEIDALGREMVLGAYASATRKEASERVKALRGVYGRSGLKFKVRPASTANPGRRRRLSQESKALLDANKILGNKIKAVAGKVPSDVYRQMVDAANKVGDQYFKSLRRRGNWTPLFGGAGHPRLGDRVTFVDRSGKQRTGKMVMTGPAGYVLNMGGPHGTPQVVHPDQIVKVTPRRRGNAGKIDRGAFNVYLHGKLIDRVFYSPSAKVTPDEVKRSLVNHDGYDPAIVVKKRRLKRGQ